MSLAKRWTVEQKNRALQIVNDIAEDIDNHESRAELRQALAIYADMFCDVSMWRQEERDKVLVANLTKLDALIKATNQKWKP